MEKIKICFPVFILWLTDFAFLTKHIVGRILYFFIGLMHFFIH